MSSRERRMLHLAFRAYEEVETASVGEGVERSLVVFPKGYDHAAYERTLPPPRPRTRETPARG